MQKLGMKNHFIAGEPRHNLAAGSNYIQADVPQLAMLICKAKADPVKRSSGKERVRIWIRTVGNRIEHKTRQSKFLFLYFLNPNQMIMAHKNKHLVESLTKGMIQ